MSDTATTTIDTYFDMWNETDQERRAELIERAWTTDGRLARITGFFGDLPA